MPIKCETKKLPKIVQFSVSVFVVVANGEEIAELSSQLVREAAASKGATASAISLTILAAASASGRIRRGAVSQTKKTKQRKRK